MTDTEKKKVDKSSSKSEHTSFWVDPTVEASKEMLRNLVVRLHSSSNPFYME